MRSILAAATFLVHLLPLLCKVLLYGVCLCLQREQGSFISSSADLVLLGPKTAMSKDAPSDATRGNPAANSIWESMYVTAILVVGVHMTFDIGVLVLGWTR